MKETTEIQPQILIIDDDVTLCAGLSKLLTGRGYKSRPCYFRRDDAQEKWH